MVVHAYNPKGGNRKSVNSRSSLATELTGHPGLNETLKTKREKRRERRKEKGNGRGEIRLS